MARRLTTLALALLLAAACGREGDPSTTAAPSPSPAPAAVASPSATPRITASASPTARTAVRTTPAAASGCRNSTSPSCGPLRFDPDPDDDPVTVRVSFSPASPKAGDTVTFTVRGADPDSGTVELGTYDFGPRGSAHIERGETSSCPRGYGPWDPPATEAGSGSATVSYRYTSAGTYEATFTFLSRSDGRRLPGDEDGRCLDPYASSGKADVVVRVR